jgi:hypothetical protein
MNCRYNATKQKWKQKKAMKKVFALVTVLAAAPFA